MGPEGVEAGRLSKGEYEGVLREFPRLGLREGGQGDYVPSLSDEAGDDV